MIRGAAHRGEARASTQPSAPYTQWRSERDAVRAEPRWAPSGDRLAHQFARMQTLRGSVIAP